MDWRLTFGGVLVLLAGGVAAGQQLLSPRPVPDRGASRADPAPSGPGTALSVHWQRLPLGDAIGRLNEASSTVVFLDRRVDPTQRVSLSVQAAAVDQIATELAGVCGLGTSQFEGLVYMGPAESAKFLATLAVWRRQEVAGLPTDAERSLSGRRRIGWPRLTEPRDLVVRSAQVHGWRVRHSARIAHDLWPAGQLPPLPVTDQLTLLLVGFDLTFRLVPGEVAIEIALIDAVPPLTRDFELRGVEHPGIDELAQQFPQASLQLADGRLRAEGRWEELEQIGRLLRGPGPARPAERPRPPAKQVFTLRVEEQPVGAVLEALARQLNWELEIDQAAIRGAGRSLDRRISLAVENVAVEELLEALLRPAGLSFKREGNRIQIGPR